MQNFFEQLIPISNLPQNPKLSADIKTEYSHTSATTTTKSLPNNQTMNNNINIDALCFKRCPACNINFLKESDYYLHQLSEEHRENCIAALEKNQEVILCSLCENITFVRVEEMRNHLAFHKHGSTPATGPPPPSSAPSKGNPFSPVAQSGGEIPTQNYPSSVPPYHGGGHQQQPPVSSYSSHMDSSMDYQKFGPSPTPPMQSSYPYGQPPAGHYTNPPIDPRYLQQYYDLKQQIPQQYDPSYPSGHPIPSNNPRLNVPPSSLPAAPPPSSAAASGIHSPPHLSHSSPHSSSHSSAHSAPNWNTQQQQQQQQQQHTVDFSAMMADNDTVIPCDICGVTICGIENYQQHVAGRQHQRIANLKSMKDVEDIGGGVLRCKLCDVTVTSRENYEAHIIGSRHKKNVTRQELMQGGGGTIPQTSNPYQNYAPPVHFCEVCQADFIEPYETHVAGDRHQRNLAAQRRSVYGEQPRGSTSNNSSSNFVDNSKLYCKLCSYSATSEKDMMTHKFSAEHFKKMSLQQ